MLGATALAARLRAFELMELAQGEAHASALVELEALEVEAERHAWTEVALLASAGQGLYAVVHEPDRERVATTLDLLVSRAEAGGSHALTSVCLALRAVAAGARGDGAALLADGGRAVALVEDESLPALERCTALVICAAAYNSLSLWELVDELYDQAAALSPLCEKPVQDPAIAMNRVILRLEWAAALFEMGDAPGALAQLQRATEAVPPVLRTPDVPPLWRHEARACGDVLALVGWAFGPAPDDEEVSALLEGVRTDHDTLGKAGAVEVLPLMAALVALSLHRLGRYDEAAAAARALEELGSPSTGARSFPAWVRAHVLTGDQPGEALAAHGAYGLHMARSRWASRVSVLAAARSKITSERMSVEHARLSRDVLLDPLTGLSNRREFDAWLGHEPDADTAAAVILVDIDAFKQVNDGWGHAVGDEVLREVAHTLAAQVRHGDLALRLGGDEFAVVMTGSLDPHRRLHELATDRAHALHDAVAAVDWSRLDERLAVQVSVGVAAGPVGPSHPDAPLDLYRLADAELYEAKALRARRTSAVSVSLPPVGRP